MRTLKTCILLFFLALLSMGAACADGPTLTLSAEAGDRQITCSWAATGFASESKVVLNIAQSADDIGSEYVKALSPNTFVITGLTNGCTYFLKATVSTPQGDISSGVVSCTPHVVMPGLEIFFLNYLASLNLNEVSAQVSAARNGGDDGLPVESIQMLIGTNSAIQIGTSAAFLNSVSAASAYTNDAQEYPMLLGSNIVIDPSKNVDETSPALGPNYHDMVYGSQKSQDPSLQLTVDAGDGKITYHWVAEGIPDGTSIDVYCSAGETIWEIPKDIVELPTNAYTVTGLENGVTYKAWLVTHFFGVDESMQKISSNRVDVTPVESIIKAINMDDNSKQDTPPDTYASLVNGAAVKHVLCHYGDQFTLSVVKGADKTPVEGVNWVSSAQDLVFVDQEGAVKIVGFGQDAVVEAKLNQRSIARVQFSVSANCEHCHAPVTGDDPERHITKHSAFDPKDHYLCMEEQTDTCAACGQTLKCSQWDAHKPCNVCDETVCVCGHIQLIEIDLSKVRWTQNYQTRYNGAVRKLPVVNDLTDEENAVLSIKTERSQMTNGGVYTAKMTISLKEGYDKTHLLTGKQPADTAWKIIAANPTVTVTVKAGAGLTADMTADKDKIAALLDFTATGVNNEALAGALSVKQNPVPAAGGWQYIWIFTPERRDNYYIESGSVIVPWLRMIEITGDALCKEYVYGDAFKLDGLTVTLRDADGTQKDVTADAIPSALDTIGENQTVTLTYGALTAQVTGVTVQKAEPDVGVVRYPDSAPALYAGQALSIAESGLTHSGTAAGALSLAGAEGALTGTGAYTWLFTPEDTAHYNTATGTVQLTVLPDEPIALAVTGAPVKTSYVYGDTFDKTGILVNLTYRSGRIVDVTADAIPSALDTIGENQTVTLTCGALTATVGGLTVRRAQIDLSALDWLVPATYHPYDENEYAVTLENRLSEAQNALLTITVTGDKGTEPGVYTASAAVALKEEHAAFYDLLGANPIRARWRIAIPSQVTLTADRFVDMALTEATDQAYIELFIDDMLINPLCLDGRSAVTSFSSAHGAVTFSWTFTPDDDKYWPSSGTLNLPWTN